MLIDSHCHLSHGNYTKSTETLIHEAHEVGVTKLINVGTSIKDNLRNLQVSEKFSDVYSTVAIYPHEDKEKSVRELQEALESQLKLSNKIVAIGECGIDLGSWEGGRTLEEQRELFEMHIRLALENDLPLVVHNRGGDGLVLELLDKYKNKKLRGVAHCFASDWVFAQELLKRDFYLSFSGMITYKSRSQLREVVSNVPQEAFLVETDAPYLPPEGFRGLPNEPKHVVEVVKKIAEIKNLPFDKVCDLSYSTTCRLFKLPS